MQHEFVATLDSNGWVSKAIAEKDKAKYWQEWRSRLANQSNLISHFALLPETSVSAQLPPLSFTLHVPFRLQKPYISKDESDFYLLDNSLRKEKVFQVPMVAATSWKGALRAALWQLDKENHPVTIRLLGNPRGSDEHQAGRLYFFPTFFDKIGLEVINPHSRETGVGERGPILMECVPEGIGTFALVYVPFGPVEQSESEKQAEVAQDLELLAEGVQAMLTLYGFGAKTSSGFGTAKDELNDEGKLAIRAALSGLAAPPEPVPEPEDSENEKEQLQADIEQFLKRFNLTHFPQWTNEELASSGWGRKRQSVYKKLRNRHPNWDNATHSWQTEAADREPEPEPEPDQPEAPPLTEFTFTTLSDLQTLARHVAEQLREGGKA